MKIKSIRRSANRVAHSLARYVRHIDNDIVWLEDSPPPALEALYVDSLSIFDWMVGKISHGNSHNVEEFEINTSVIYKLFSVCFVEIIFVNLFYYSAYFCYYLWVPLYYFS